jgi:hypothetical protein
MKFMGACPRCNGQLVLEDSRDDEIYCWSCGYRKPDDGDLVFDDELGRYRPITTAERLLRPGYNDATHRSRKNPVR